MAAVNQLLSLSDDLISIIDEEGRILEVNHNWKKVLQESLVGRDLREIVEEEEGGKSLHHFFTDHQMSMLKLNSCRIKGTHGQRTWVDLRIRRIPSQNKYWCLLRDITVKKFRNTVLDNIAEACQLGYWKFHSSSQELVWSERVFTIFQKHPQFYRPHIEDFRMILPEEVLREFETMETSHFDITFSIRVDHQDKWIRIKGNKEVFEDYTYEYQGIIQDVTIEVLKERIHLSSNIELSSFEKGLDQFSIVARTDAKGRIIQANKEFCRLSKYTEEELIGKDHRIVNSGHHPKSFFAEMWKCIKEGKNWRGEVKNKAKDGSYYWVDTIVIPIRNSNEELVEILSFRFEITQHKQVEEENHILREQLNLLTQSETTFAWKYDFKEKRFAWNDQLPGVFDCQANAHFEEVIAQLNEDDQRAIKNFLQSQETHLTRTVFCHGKQVRLSFKVSRLTSGEVLVAEGICSLICLSPAMRRGMLATA